jgi:hypothetical protein
MRQTQPMYRYSHEVVARACHAVLSVMNDAQGPPWATVPFEPFDSLPAEEQGIWYEQVRAARRGATPRELFGQWAAARRALHWTWGPVRDTDRKTHPNLVAYDDLPASQRDKDKAFLGTVTFLTDVTPVLPGRAGLPDAVTAILWKTAKVRHAR